MGLAHAADTEKVQRFLGVSLELMQPVACAMLTSDYAAQAGDLLPLLLPTLGAVSEQLGPACKLQHQQAVWTVCRCVFLSHLVLLANMPSCHWAPAATPQADDCLNTLYFSMYSTHMG